MLVYTLCTRRLPLLLCEVLLVHVSVAICAVTTVWILLRLSVLARFFI
eukprot:gene9151-12343_t